VSVAAPGLSRDSLDEGGRPRIPRAIAALVLGAIAFASLVALLWPALPFSQAPLGQVRVNVITRQIEASGSGGVVGKPAPDFEWATPDGRTQRFSDLRGAPVVVNFWATWCVPCREEMPALERVAKSDSAARFLAVDLDEDGERIRGFFDRLGIEALVPMLDVNAQAARRFGVVSLPITFFVDAGGVVRDLEVGGPMTDARIRAGLAKAR